MCATCSPSTSPPRNARAEAEERAAEARRFAAEVAARQAEEAVAREAEMRTCKQRLIARATAMPKGGESGEAPRKSYSAPIRTMALPPVTTDIFSNIAEPQEQPSSAQRQVAARVAARVAAAARGDVYAARAAG